MSWFTFLRAFLQWIPSVPGSVPEGRTVHPSSRHILYQTCRKGRQAHPEVSFPAHFAYGTGITNMPTFLYALIKNGNIRKDGSYYEYKTLTGDTIKQNGIDIVRDFCNKLY